MEKRKLNVLIGCTGSVATIKLPLILELLEKKGCFNTKVCLTDKALHFCGVEEIKHLTEVYTDEAEWSSWKVRGDPVLHIDLTKWADLFVIAPLDANSLGKISSNRTSGLVPQLKNSSQYVYTLENNLLNDEQRSFYEENGYLVLPGLIEDEILDACSQRFVDLCEGRVPRGGITMMKDISVVKSKQALSGESLFYKAQDILYDEVFERFFLHPKLLDVVSCFTGDTVVGVHSMLINKPPDTGTLSSRHPLHQDLYYFPFRPAERIVAAWTAMEQVNENNGCLFVLPGSHRGQLHQHSYPDWEGGVNKAFHGVQGFDKHPKLFLPMNKGDTVFFHPLLLHGSGYNKTKGFRKAISCHYAGGECDFIDVRGTVQEEIVEEIKGMAIKKGFADASIVDIWKYRSRLARGNTSNFDQ